MEGEAVMVKLTLLDANDFVQSVLLDGEPYKLHFAWNDTSKAWTLDLRDSHGKDIVRGIRSVADYEYEHQLSGMNRHLLPQAETVFLITADRYSFVSSSLIRETARLGGDVGELVHASVKKNLTTKVCTQS